MTVTSDGVAATSYGTHDNIYLSFGGPLAMSSVLVHGSIVHGYHSLYQRFMVKVKELNITYRFKGL